VGLTLYYYSSTGNSLHAAQTIATKVAGAALIAMPPLQQIENVTPPTTSIGLVFPMHYFGLPPMVEEFVNKLDLTSVAYIFAIVTCGDHHLSSCLHQLEEILLTKDRKLDSGFYVDMISSYVPLFPLPALEKRQQLLATADDRLGKISDLISECSHNVATEYCWWLSSGINKYWKKRLLPQSYRKFSSDATCTACGACEKICPVSNIRLISGKPIWRHHCQECLACFHFCPVQSINVGTRTRGRERYHHPQVTAADIIQSRSKEQTK
jgi:ferredoxin